MPKMTHKTLTERCTKSRQGWTYEHVLKVTGSEIVETKLRASIYRDSHNFQSWARVERWDGDEWQTVLSRSIEEMGPKVLAVSYTGRAVARDFLIAANVMIADAIEIVR